MRNAQAQGVFDEDRIYGVIKRLDWLAGEADFHLFKHGVSPSWEDDQCKDGGMLTLRSSVSEEGWTDLQKHWLRGVRSCCCLASLIVIPVQG